MEIVFVEGIQFQHVTSGVGVGQTHGREPRALFDHASEDLPERLLGVLGGAQSLDQSDSPCDLPKRPDGPHGEPLPDMDILVDISQLMEVYLVPEGQFDGLDFLVGALGEVGECPMANLSVLPVRLAEQVPGVHFSVGGVCAGVDKHSGHIIATILQQYKPNNRD